MDEKRIREIFSDEAFVKELVELEEPYQVQAALREKGVEMTESEIVELRAGILKLTGSCEEGDELSLEQLEEAAGGFGLFGLGVALAAAVVFAGVVIGCSLVSSLNARERW